MLEAMEKIIHCFFQKQQILLEMEKKAVRMEQDAASRRAMERKAMKSTFNIHPLLSGYLRGKQNQNLAMVKRGDGGPGHNHKGQVLRVDPMATSCYVAATTKPALEWAIDHLMIVCKKVMIPNDEMGQIIGFKGALIQEIKARSNVIKVIFGFSDSINPISTQRSYIYGERENIAHQCWRENVVQSGFLQFRNSINLINPSIGDPYHLQYGPTTTTHSIQKFVENSLGSHRWFSFCIEMCNFINLQ